MITLVKKKDIEGILLEPPIVHKHFEDSDVTNKDTDKSISHKLIDKNGEVLILLEATTQDYYSDGDTKGYKGCFIHRFEYVENLVDAPTLNAFIQQFYLSVECCLVLCDESQFKCRYQYVWAITKKTDSSFLNSVLRLQTIEENDEFIVSMIRREMFATISN